MTTLLAADVGNTNVVLGVYDEAKLVSTWRTATRQDQTEDELAVMIDALLGREDLSLDDVDALVRREDSLLREVAPDADDDAIEEA